MTLIKFQKLIKKNYMVGLIIFIFLFTSFLITSSNLSVLAILSSQKLKVAVFGIQDKSGQKFKNVEEKALSSIYSILTKLPQIQLIPKEEVEKKVVGVKLEDVEKLVAIAEELKATAFIIGSIDRIVVRKNEEAIVTMNIQLIQTSTAEVIGEVTSDGTSGIKPGYKGALIDLINEAIYNTTQSISDELITNYNTEGIVLSTYAQRVRINLGKVDNIKIGSKIGVFREGDIVAVLQVSKVESRTSEATIIRKLPGITLYSGDKIKIVSIPKKPIEITEEGKPVPKKKKIKWEKVALGALVLGAITYFFTKEKKEKPEEVVTVIYEGRTISGALSDVTPQLKVKNVKVSPTKDRLGNLLMKIEWTPLDYYFISGYHIYRAEGEEAGKPVTSFVKIADIQKTECTATKCVYLDTGTPAKLKSNSAHYKLIENTIYWYRIRAYDTKGNLSQESDLTATSKAVAGEIAPPNPPEIITTEAGYRKVTLTWLPPTYRIDGTPITSAEIASYTVAYSLYDTRTASCGTDIGYETGIKGTTFTVSGLTNNQSYCFKVQCIDTKGKESEYSAIKIATPIPAPAPSSPQWLSPKIGDYPDAGLRPGTGKVTLQWYQVKTRKDGTTYKEGDEDQIRGYYIYRTQKKGATFPTDFGDPVGYQQKPEGEIISYDDTTPEAATSYYYCITAVNTEETESDPSTILGPVIPEKPRVELPAPSGLTAEADIIQIKITWNSVEGADGYKVYSCNVPSGSCSPAIEITQTTQTTFTHKNLNYKNIYYYEVTTLKEGVESKHSLTVSAQPKPPTPPAPPKWPTQEDGYNALIVQKQNIILNWKPVTTDVNDNSLEDKNLRIGKYKIYRSQASTYEEGAYGTYNEIGEVKSPTVSYTDITPKQKGYFYFYKVQAILDYEYETIESPLSEYRYAQVEQPTLVLYTPEPGAWLVGDTTVVDEAKNLCETKWFGDKGVQYAWSPVQGAARYIVEFAHEPNMASLETNLIVNAPTTQTEHTWFTGKYPCGMLIDINLWWRVKAVSDENVAIALSEIRGHTLSNYVQQAIQKQPSPPTISTSPDEVTPSYVKFSFTPPITNTDGTTMQGDELPALFKIYRSTSPTGPFYYYDIVLSGQTSYIDTGVEPGETYYYKMSTVNKASREGPQTPNMITAKIPEANTPSAPANLRVTEATDGRVILEWDEVTTYIDGTGFVEGDGVAYYDVHRAELGTITFTSIGSSTATTFTDNNVINGLTYYYKVKVMTKQGKESSFSNMVSATALSTGIPPAVTQVKAYPLDASVELTWVWPRQYGIDLKGFKLWKDGEVSDQIVTTLPQCQLVLNEYNCRYIDSAVANGKTYEYKILAFTLAEQLADEDAAASLLATPLSASEPTLGPQWESNRPRVDPTRSEEVQVEWTSAGYEGAEGFVDLSGFKLYCADTASNLQQAFIMEQPLLDVTISKDTEGKNNDRGDKTYPLEEVSKYIDRYYNGATITDMLPGKVYWVAIKAYRYVDLNKNGIQDSGEIFYSPFSELKTAQPYSATPPPAPQWIASTPENPNPEGLNTAVSLEWEGIDMPEDLYGYRVRRASTCTSPSTATIVKEIPTPGETSGSYSHVDPGLTNGTTYCYWIEAVRRGSDGKWTDGKSTFSEPRTATPLPSPAPAAPVWQVPPLVAECELGICSVTVNWDTVTGAVTYKIYRATSATGTYTEVGSVNHPQVSYKDEGLMGTQTYYYRLKAVNADGIESVFSDYRYITPEQPNITLIAPENNQTFVAPDVTTGVTIQFRWSTVSDATGYLLEIASDSGIATIYHQQVVDTPSHEWSTGGLTLPPTLYWRVTAYLPNGTTVKSEVRNFNITYITPP